MLKIRIIPVLLLKNGRMVKPIKFGKSGERDVGDPITTAKIYNSQDADELIFLDINATHESRSFLLDTLQKVGKNCFIPLTVGGGIKNINDIKDILKSGADKISINSEAVKNPDLINESSKIFGSQCIVISIDFKENNQKKYEVFIEGGKTSTNLDPIEWAKEVVKRGAGEILLTSIDKEGTMQGYDLNMTKKIVESVTVPVIINGGAGSRKHFTDAIQFGNVSAIAASSIFHFSDSNITQVKSFIYNQGFPVRPI